MDKSQKLDEVMALALSVPLEEINDDLAYQSIPEWDSMSHMVLMTELETAFGISIETDDMLEMNTMPKVREILQKYGVMQTN
ncbi:acyl carrier protein [Pedobacter cryoconitis]|uniref:Acyl carrier protein n=1 Tax=Pedobacter cryoconitis TaxID=188932 RepID=A0A7X0J6T6_9SPHI|nr:acyl carrier protein [Pedobacter cryoconitis]MBB6501699.1 acyl carrier protein [Pedobacter cryoconitis]